MNRHSFGHKFKGYDHTEETESTKFHQSEQLPNLTNEPPHSEKGQAGTVKAKAIEPDHKEQLHHLFNQYVIVSYHITPAFCMSLSILDHIESIFHFSFMTHTRSYEDIPSFTKITAST